MSVDSGGERGDSYSEGVHGRLLSKNATCRIVKRIFSGEKIARHVLIHPWLEGRDLNGSLERGHVNEGPDPSLWLRFNQKCRPTTIIGWTIWIMLLLA
jgi:hypothetical protein